MLQKLLLSSLVLILFSTSNFAQSTNDVDIIVDNDNYYELDLNESSIMGQLQTKSSTITLPMGRVMKQFSIEEFSIYGDRINPWKDVIKTYRIQSVDDPTLKGRVVTGPLGINISYLGSSELQCVFPQEIDGKRKYFFQNGGVGPDGKAAPYTCGGHDHAHDHGFDIPELPKIKENINKRFGGTKRILRVAVVTTGEYYQANGNSSASVASAAITLLSDISAILERELNIVLEMASGAPDVRYTDPSTDAFNPGAGGLPAQANREVRNLFNDNRYDIGHVFHNLPSGGAGVASLGVVCRDDLKGSGWSGFQTGNPAGFARLSVHEFGHQFSMPHTFNGIGNICDTQIGTNNSYEVASGVTLMSYNGLCNDDQNVLDNSGETPIPSYVYFHAISLQQAINQMETVGADCNVNNYEVDVNQEPTVNANPCGAVFRIPDSTPFFLQGEGSDPDGDPLTYSWEQFDEDGPGTPTQGFIGNTMASNPDCPIFRCFPPTGSALRHFPRKSTQRAGINSDPYERLPTRARNLTFRLVGRDNNPDGNALDWDEISVRVVNSSFAVTAPNDGTEVFNTGETMKVIWEVNGAESICDKADIRLSTDGGSSFGCILKADVDFGLGTADVVLPFALPSTEQARIQVVCADYECFGFYDYSNRDFVINSQCSTPAGSLCDTDLLEADFRADELNLGLSLGKGSEMVDYYGEVDIATDPRMLITLWNGNVNQCSQINTERPYDAISITPTKSGTYRFSFGDVSGSSSNVGVYSIFRASNFNPASPCPSFVSSNSRRSGNNPQSSIELSVNLEACEEYVLASITTSDSRNDISILGVSGPGQLLRGSTDPIPNATYVAVNDLTGVIDLVQSDSDFVNLAPGDYKIYSIVYDSGNPSSWVGSSLDDLLNMGTCMNVSKNFKPVVINSACAISNVVLGQQSDCNPIDNTYSQTLSFGVDLIMTSSGTVVVNDQAFPYSGGVTTITLSDLIADGEQVNLDFSFSDDAGCLKTLAAVFEAPENCCPIDIPVQDFRVCEGDPVVLNAGNDGETYQWFLFGADLGVTDNSYTPEESGTYRVLVTDSNGCEKDAVSNVAFDVPPVVEITTDPMPGCERQGTYSLIEADVVNADSSHWLVNGMRSTEYENRDKFLAYDGGTYELIVYNGGCQRSDTYELDFLDFTEFNILDKDEDDRIRVCDNEDLFLSVDMPGQDYTWEILNPDTPVGTGATIQVTETGSYVAAGTNSDGCVYTDTVTVRFVDTPVIDLGEDIEVCGDRVLIVESGLTGGLTWIKDRVEILDRNLGWLVNPEPGEYIAEVIVSDNCFARDTINIDFFDLPEVELGSDLSFCEGEEFEVELYAGELGLGLIYTWFYNAEFAMNPRGTLVATEPGEYRVRVTDDETDCMVEDTVNITLISNPMLTLPQGPIEVCDGSQVAIEAMSSVEFLTWFLDDEPFLEDRGTTINVSEAGTYKAVVGDGQCEAEASVQVVSIPSPVVALEPINFSCGDDGVLLEAGPDGAFDYFWLQGGVPIPGANQGSYLATEEDSYTVRATGANDCETEVTTFVRFTGSFSVSLPPFLTGCLGEELEITAGSETSEVVWTWDGEPISQTGLTISVDQPGIYQATVGTGTACENSETVIVDFGQGPSLDLGEDVEICEGQTAELVGGPDGQFEYTWYKDNDIFISGSEGTLTVSEAGTYRLELSDGGCTVTDEVVVSVISLVEVTPTQDTYELCESALISISVETASPIVTWKLDNNDIAPETAEIMINQAGTYTAFVGAGTLCESMATIVVTSLPAPAVDLGDDIEGCLGEEYELIAGDDGDFNYTWSRDNNEIKDGPEGSLQVTESGNYTVVVTADNECTAEDVVIVSIEQAEFVEIIEEEYEFCSSQGGTIEVESNSTDITWLLGGMPVAGSEPELFVSQEGTYTAIVGEGTSCEDMVQISVVLLESPEIDVGPDVTSCASSIELMGGDDGLYEYSWFLNGNLAGRGSGTLTVNAGGEYVLEATNGIGCVTTDTINVSFEASPTLELIQAEYEFCETTGGTIAVQSNAAAIIWVFEGQDLNTSDTELEVMEAGEYTAFVGRGETCEMSVSIVVTFTDAPELMDIPDISGCEGMTSTIIAGDDGDFVYTWSDDSGEIKSGPEGSLEVTVSGSIYLMADQGGCIALDTIIVDLSPASSVEIEAEEEYCDGEVAILVANTGSTVLTWFAGNDIIQGESGTEISVTDAGTYRAVSALGEACEMSDEITITFSESPDIEVDAFGEACEDDIFVIEAGPDGDYDYVWSLLDGTVLQEGNEGSFEIDATATIVVTAINDTECETSDTIEVAFLEAPMVDMTPEYFFCEGEVGLIVANTSESNVTWYLGNDVLNETTPELEVTLPGTYRAVVGEGLECDAEASTVVDFLEAPSVELLPQTECVGDEIVLIAGNDPDNTYTWFLNGIRNAEESGTLILTEMDFSGSAMVRVECENLASCEAESETQVEFLSQPRLEAEDELVFCDGEDAIIETDTDASMLTWYRGTTLLPDTGTSLEVDREGTYRAIAGEGLQCSVEIEIEVTFEESPDISIDEQSKCTGEEAVFMAGPDGDFEYTWTVGGAMVSETSGTLVLTEADVNMNAEVIVTARNMAGCETTISANVSFVDTPTLDADTELELCDGETGTIEVMSNTTVLDWFLNTSPINESGTTIMVTEPGTYRAVAGLGQTCENSIEIEVTVVPSPPLDLQGEQEICEGDPAVLMSNADAGDEIMWFQNTDPIMGQNGTELDINESGEYKVIVTNAEGCSKTDSILVDIVPLATATLGMLPSGICQGVPFEVEATSDGVRFEWEDGNGTIAGADGSSYEFSESGDYKFIAYNSIDCATEIEFSLEFIPAPAIDIGSDVSECEGEIVELSTASLMDVDFQWSLDGMPINGATSESIIADASGIYSLSAINDIGCETIREVEVEFIEFPSISPTEDEVAFCQGETATLEVDTDATIIEWYLGSTLVEENVTSIEVDVEGTYRVVANTPQDCAAETIINVTEIILPEISLNDIELCEGEEQAIEISPDFDTYTWTGAGISSTSNEATVVYQSVPEVTTEVVTVIGEDSNGCSVEESFSVTFFPELDASAESLIYEICTGDQVVLEVFGGSTYAWTDPSGSLSAVDVSNPVASPTETTMYEVTVGDICDNSVTFMIEVIVNDLPDAFAGEDRSVVPERVATLEASGGVSYQWSNTEFIVGSSNQQEIDIEIDSAQTFVVTVTDENGCVSTDEVFIDIINDVRLVVTPITAITPNGDDVNDILEFPGLDIFPDNKLTIFSRWGNVVFEKVRYQGDDVRWDGTRNGIPLPADTYYYILEFEGEKIKSSITLLKN